MDQSSSLIPSTSFSHDKDKLTFSFSNIKARIDIISFKDEKIKSYFIQNKNKFEIEMVRIPRPQEPRHPFNYEHREIQINNKEIVLNGTLTIPQNKEFQKNGLFPAVILITGSGAQNRDEELFGHKPFLVLSDFLTNLGIVVLRVDDRGVGKDINLFSNADSFDFLTDCIAQLNFLKTLDFVDKNRIGIIGHSEGGLISFLAASKFSSDFSFIISLAGPSQRGDKLLLTQQELIAKALSMKESDIKKMLQINSSFFELIIKYKDDPSTEELEKEIKELAKKFKLTKNETQQVIAQLTSKWMRTYILLDPAEYLKDIKCPVLALFGEKDLQVSANINSEIMKSVFDSMGKTNYEILILKSHNHLFQNAKTGNIYEYCLINETISNLTLEKIKEFLFKNL